TLLLLLALGSAQAQEKPAPVAPPPADLEPAVDTTRTPPANTAPAAAVAPKSDSAAPAAQTNAAGGKARAQAPRAGKGNDRVELETTDITGNRELPKVLYIVPWKRSDLGDLVGKPPNSLLDEVLQPIDRDVFLRENRYYDALKPDRAGPRAGTVPGSGEKP
ncbi:MAG: hypothetical protein KGJ68_08835, partial [Gammaproteobacteria bacterium]|nr:hypothetical protein [Gammaproteobacteria bacterium]